MGNCQCFKSQQDHMALDSKKYSDRHSQNKHIQNSTGAQNGKGYDPNMKNPFKKKRGEGYVPPHQQITNDELLPKESLATYSLMNQAAQKEEEMNDALVPGTFGGDKLPIAVSSSDIGPNDDRVSNNSNSYYGKPSNYNKEGPSMSITGSDGMLSFNPSGLTQAAARVASNPSLSGKNGEAPPMSFGGATLQDMIKNES